MDETTRRTAVLSIGSALLLSGCSDAVDSDDGDGVNGTEGDDGNEADDGNDASGEEPEGNESDSDEDVGETEDVGDDGDTVEADADDKDETTEDDRMSTDEFVTEVAAVYDGEVAAYDEDETHGSLTLVGDADASQLELARDVQDLLAVYSSYVERGDAPTEQLEGAVEADDGQAIGNVTVRTEWVEAYNRGDISEGELRDRVLGTVEP
ncbi:hypothetical protein QA600_11335 [Natronococcus sp. A-GB1]|uniref:hypothetical protein n=1 Tax=Natronococcus sp. A-GB1 TaxID=3037648 RepID=UPI00241FF7D6|nr:hypothetical protein [Natronococcus sp. A-GB1]MDG5759932.1 hypothetical protein [Natronococcus sp. A-GB1]